MPPLRAGQLRTQVTLQSRVSTGDGQGGQSFTWVPVATLWARVVPAQTTGDTPEADQVVSRRAYTVTIRRRDGVTSAMRVVRGSQLLEITAVLASDAEPDATVLECREVPS